MPSNPTAFASASFLNRELSWLEFNQRVLNEAQNPKNPLLERVKFFCITSSNLDEFFEVRVAGLKQQVESGVIATSADGLAPVETFQAVVRRIRQMADDQSACWREQLLPELEKNGIRFLEPEKLDSADLLWLEQFYRDEVRPVLTPLAIDPAHPFPQLLNKSLNIIVQLQMRSGVEMLRHLAVVQVPRVLPRLIKLPRFGGERDYVFLGRVIGRLLEDIFPGTKILGYWHFRVTRNSELYIDEEEMANLLKAVENELHNRRRGDAVRLEIDQDCPSDIYTALLRTLRLTEDDLYLVDGPVNPTRLMAIYEGDHSPELRDPPFAAPVAAALAGETDIFAAIRERDILLHHPYENFGSVVDFLEQSARDPKVLAIKQTLYRTGGDTRIIGALMEAVNNGKQVTVVVELRARFDEANNIQWARQLEEAGVHVVYGLVGYKIHAKMCLVVRADEGGIRHYVHVGTGNYNPTTSKIYTDLGLLTCHREFGEDATNLFNLLTGICQFQETKKFLVAPFQLHSKMLAFIERETKNAREGQPARIIAKMNALVDREIIEALYRASQAGVKIDLIVRGICCLRPQKPGLSENITVRSIVGRFLEHSRIFYFENAGQPEIFIGSADWLPRNFFRRIEVVFPVEDANLRERIKTDLLDVCLADNTNASFLQADGSYLRPDLESAGPRHQSQEEFMEMALEGESRQSLQKPKYQKVKAAYKPNKKLKV